jgi:hypothetical protein
MHTHRLAIHIARAVRRAKHLLLRGIECDRLAGIIRLESATTGDKRNQDRNHRHNSEHWQSPKRRGPLRYQQSAAAAITLFRRQSSSGGYPIRFSLARDEIGGKLYRYPISAGLGITVYLS